MSLRMKRKATAWSDVKNVSGYLASSPYDFRVRRPCHFTALTIANPVFSFAIQTPPPLYAAAKPASLIVVDQGIQDWPYLVSLLPASSAHTEVVILDGGLDQLATHLAHRPAGSLHALHLLCHGRSGGLLLGKQWLTQANLATHADSLRQIKPRAGDRRRLVVYGCEVAQGDAAGALWLHWRD
ncbi:MAG: DUF4347 domain-containing protein [Rivihabitans pingtungensis]